MDRLSSPGVRQLSVGEVRVRVRGERGVLGVRGEGRVSQALYPLGGGVGIATPERWQQPSASDIQASKSFSLSQSKRVYTYRLEWICTVCIFSKYCSINEWMCCEGLWQSYECQLSLPTNTHHVLGAGPQQWRGGLVACLPSLRSTCPSACAGPEASVPHKAERTEWEKC